MTALTIKLSESPALRGMLQRIGYRRKTARLIFADRCELNGRYWDGGSISRYWIVDIVPSRVTPVPQVSPPQFGGPREAVFHDILPNQCVISCGTFCGKPGHAFVYMPRETALMWLGTEIALQLSREYGKHAKHGGPEIPAGTEIAP